MDIFGKTAGKSYEQQHYSDHCEKLAILKNVDINVAKNSLTAILGVIGSGKSSILQAILGEMEMISGQMKIYGNISYMSQQPWIQNLSLKGNQRK